MTTRELDAPANFRTKVNLVLVPVIVRDKKGNPVGTLKKEDFELYDKGKLQTIEKFSVEKAGSRHVEFEPGLPTEDPAVTPQAPMAVAERYTAFVFDDLHLAISDLMQVRIAAEKHLATAMLPTERVAVYTTSGRTVLELTDDRDAIIASIRRIQAASRVASSRQACPPMTFYMADLIVNKEFPSALQAATLDAMSCLGL